MKRKALITVLGLLTVMLASMFVVVTARSSETPTIMDADFNVTPYQYLQADESQILGGEGIPTFNIDMVDVDNIEEDGEGIYVAVLDTGLLKNWKYFFPKERIARKWGTGYTHDVWWDWNEMDFMFGPLKERDFITGPYGSGHGTHVSSILIGYNYLDRFYVKGVAPKVTIIPVLVLDAWVVPDTPWGTVLLTGGTDEMIAAGIRYIADLAVAKGIKIIINMSLGGPVPMGIVEEAINYAIERGVIIVAAAGNQRWGPFMDWPGAYPQVISAAASGWTLEFVGNAGPIPNFGFMYEDVVEELNTPDLFGNNFQHYLIDWSGRPNPDYGQSMKDLDVSAPGCAVLGPYKPYGLTEWDYYWVWGTSQATPHVAGIAALVLQNHPNIGQQEMEWILRHAATSNPIPSDGSTVFNIIAWEIVHYTWNDHDYGTGFLQADEAIKVAG